MYILRNAIMNLGRNKGRNILMGVIVLAIIAATAVSLVIHSTTGGIIREYKGRFGAKVSIVPDMDKLMANGGQIERVTYEQYLEFGKSQYLKDSYFQNEIPLVGEKMKAVGEGKDDKGQVAAIGGGEDGSAMVMPTMKIRGYSRLDMLEEFREGMRKIIEGKVFEKKGECVISQDLAKLNGIRVGEPIHVKNAMESDLPAHTLTVTGIYQDATDEYGGTPFKGAFMNRRNEVLASFETASGMSSFGGMNIVATYYLKSPDMLPAFEKEIRDKGLTEDYIVSADEASYNQVVGPVESLSKISFTFMLVVQILGAMILILLSTIAIRERKYEIGVLRAMGMKKRNVALGLVLEMLAITILCLCMGLSFGAAAAQPIADTMLASQIADAEQARAENSAFGNMVMMGGEQSKEDPISELDVKLNFESVLQIVGIAILLAGIASITGISCMTQYEPMRILSERN